MEGSFRETALRNYGEIISGRAVVSFFLFLIYARRLWFVVVFTAHGRSAFCVAGRS